MTKKEMIIEMIPEKMANSECSMSNLMKNKKSRVEEVYNFWNISAKEDKDKRFCYDVLIVW